MIIFNMLAKIVNFAFNLPFDLPFLLHYCYFGNGQRHVLVEKRLNSSICGETKAWILKSSDTYEQVHYQSLMCFFLLILTAKGVILQY